MRHAVTLLAVAAFVQAPAPHALHVTFHHLHLNEPSPQTLFSYYGRLFDPSTTRRTRMGGHEGYESAGVFLLINRVPGAPSEDGPVWHFGWGDVSLVEGYDGHRLREEWAPPLRSLAHGLHLHLESEDPVRAAGWYRDLFGAAIETAPSHADVLPPNPLFRKPASLVRLDGLVMLVYRAVAPVPPSRGRRVDHVAFRIDEIEAARRALAERSVRAAPGVLGAFPTLTIEGPDQLAIELVGPRRVIR
jgi:hypothetical protein